MKRRRIPPRPPAPPRGRGSLLARFREELDKASLLPNEIAARKWRDAARGDVYLTLRDRHGAAATLRRAHIVEKVLNRVEAQHRRALEKQPRAERLDAWLAASFRAE